MRRFSAVSLAAVILAAVAIEGYTRTVTISVLKDLSNANAMATGRAVRAALMDRLLPYLRAAGERAGPASRPGAEPPPIPDGLRRVLRDLQLDADLVKLYLFDPRARMLYTSAPSGNDPEGEANPGAARAAAGEEASKFLYRDAFSANDEAQVNANMAQAYLPVRDPLDGSVLGVLEVYVDVGHLVARVEHMELRILWVLIGVLGLLYLTQLLYVQRADKVIGLQEGALRERKDTLEQVSVHYLQAQENEHKALARFLHEGVAQALSAVKLRVESLGAAPPRPELERIAGLLQDTIRQVRARALYLRPSSLDDLGLRPAVEWLVRDLRAWSPELVVDTEFRLDPTPVPDGRKAIVFRVLQEALRELTAGRGVAHLWVGLTTAAGAVTLTIPDAGPAPAPADGHATVGGPIAACESMRRLALLSGGHYDVADGQRGGRLHRVRWQA